MNKVYIVYREYYDGCDIWKHVHNVYLTEYLALQESDKKNTELEEDVSYYYQEQEVISE